VPGVGADQYPRRAGHVVDDEVAVGREGIAGLGSPVRLAERRDQGGDLVELVAL
jgi:hypothetical protein